MHHVSRSEFDDLQKIIGTHDAKLADLSAAKHRTNLALTALESDMREVKARLGLVATPQDVRVEGHKTRTYIVVGGVIGSILTLTLFLATWFHG